MRTDVELRQALADLLADIVWAHGDGHHSALSYPIHSRMHRVRTLEYALDMDEHVGEAIDGYDPNVELVELRTEEPRSAPDKFDGIETPEEAAAVAVSCHSCGASGYLYGTHPDEFMDRGTYEIRCPDCMPDEALMSEIMERLEDSGLTPREIVESIQTVEERHDREVDEGDYL